MFSTNLVLSVTALTAVGVAYAQNNIVVATATAGITQCQPYLIKWSGGTAPYFPVVSVASQPASVLKAFPQTNENQVLWNPVNQAAGTSVTFAVTDASGVQFASAPSIPIISSSDSSCVGKDSSSAAGGATTGASSSVAASSSSAPASSATTPASSASNSASSSSSSSTRTSAAPAATTSAPPANAANTVRGYSAVVAAVVGVAVAALL